MGGEVSRALKTALIGSHMAEWLVYQYTETKVGLTEGGVLPVLNNNRKLSTTRRSPFPALDVFVVGSKLHKVTFVYGSSTVSVSETP